MASFQPVAVIFGSTKQISTINLRFPISFIFAIDEDSLQELISNDPQLHDSCLQRYFLILLQTISDEFFERLQNNHRVQVIYTREPLTSTSQASKPHRIIKKQLQQFTLDLTADVVQFLTLEGQKQVKLERLHLTEIYYRQARLLKEWAMSFAKAEPSHILVIPLNTNPENLHSAIERIQKICAKLGYPSLIVRTLADYLPADTEKSSCLLPYADILFHHEDPQYICQHFIRKLSPIRLYLYGNENIISSQWSHLMINQETSVMEDEDSWCAFVENECISDEMKWNIGPMFGGKWKVKRIAPIYLTELDRNLRFQSALRRALKTFNPRQIEITSEIFGWYDRCVADGFLELTPKLPLLEKGKFIEDSATFSLNGRYRNLSTFRYAKVSNFKSLSFIWLDEMLNSCSDDLNEIIQPFTWNFFQNISDCLSFIENQVREQNQIFLVVSGSLGRALFASGYGFMHTVSFVYIYCSQLGQHSNWIKNYPDIRGAFNDSSTLGEIIKIDFDNIRQIQTEKNSTWLTQSQPNQLIVSEFDYDSTLVSVPITVFDPEQEHTFFSHQRTIDTLLCLPHNTEARIEMINEFRRIYANNVSILAEIELFDQTYNSNNALSWYTRNSFLFRLVNQALRFSNAELMFKLSYVLIDLYAQLDEIYRQTHECWRGHPVEKLYRGQIMSRKEFATFERLVGHLISINTFFSTTTSLQIALFFTNSIPIDDESLSVLFCIQTNPSETNERPYANISQLSHYNEEDEVLIAMGHIFRIQGIEELDRTNPIPVIYLKMIDSIQLDSVTTV